MPSISAQSPICVGDATAGEKFGEVGDNPSSLLVGDFVETKGDEREDVSNEGGEKPTVDVTGALDAATAGEKPGDVGDPPDASDAVVFDGPGVLATGDATVGENPGDVGNPPDAGDAVVFDGPGVLATGDATAGEKPGDVGDPADAVGCGDTGEIVDVGNGTAGENPGAVGDIAIVESGAADEIEGASGVMDGGVFEGITAGEKFGEDGDPSGDFVEIPGEDGEKVS